MLYRNSDVPICMTFDDGASNTIIVGERESHEYILSKDQPPIDAFSLLGTPPFPAPFGRLEWLSIQISLKAPHPSS